MSVTGVLMGEVVLLRDAPPEEILAAPASDFVARFVGADRGLKRLSPFAIEKPRFGAPPKTIALPSFPISDVESLSTLPSASPTPSSPRTSPRSDSGSVGSVTPLPSLRSNAGLPVTTTSEPWNSAPIPLFTGDFVTTNSSSSTNNSSPSSVNELWFRTVSPLPAVSTTR